MRHGVTVEPNHHLARLHGRVFTIIIRARHDRHLAGVGDIECYRTVIGTRHCHTGRADVTYEDRTRLYVRRDGTIHTLGGNGMTTRISAQIQSVHAHQAICDGAVMRKRRKHPLRRVAHYFLIPKIDPLRCVFYSYQRIRRLHAVVTEQIQGTYLIIHPLTEQLRAGGIEMLHVTQHRTVLHVDDIKVRHLAC